MGEKDIQHATNYETQTRLNEKILTARADAALQGHNISGFRPVRGMTANEAYCIKCGLAIYVSEWGIHSFLADSCPNTLSE